MTGPEHYREAEWLLERAHHWTYGDGGDPTVGLALATEAQAHATLALAAATALHEPGRSAPRSTVHEWDAWKQAAGIVDQPEGEA
jgi:hypothetical protein